MKTIIKYLKLPFRFSAGSMQQEVNALSAGWVAHYNKRDYEGSWTALPLRSLNGSIENVIADAGLETRFEDTGLMGQCPYLKTVVDSFPCEKKAIRLLNLQPGAIIKEHRDAELNFENGEARIHIPVTTNAAVDFFLEDERVVMNEGESWYMNFNMKHRLANNGNTDRIHLVMDCIVNDWMQELFTHGDWEVKSIAAAPPRYTDREKQQIIEHLLEMNTAESLRMAAEMEGGL